MTRISNTTTPMEDRYVAQYIDFYRKYKDLCNSNSPGVMNLRREEALNILEQYGLPKSLSEDYKRFDVQAILEKDWGIKLSTLKNKANPYCSCRCSMGEIAPLRFYMHDDEVYSIPQEDRATPDGSYTEALKKGVFIGSIVEFAEKHPDILQKYYGKIADMERNTLAALNTLFAKDVFVVHIPKNVELEQTIQLIMLSGGYKNALISSRVLVIVEDKAKASLLICDHSVADSSSVNNTLLEVYVGNSASFTLYDMEETHEDHIRISNAHYHLAANATAKVCPLTLTNGKTRNNIYGYIEGEHSSFTAAGLVVLDGSKRADNYVWVNHSVPHCHSDQLFKYTMDDTAVGSFTGRIYVAKDAQKTQAYQNNRGLNLSGKATMYSKPQLEIYADDVKCSHGMTVGQIDDGAVFYMRQRGIPYWEAKMLLTIAFMADVLEYIDLEPLREKLQDVLEQRYRGGNSFCHNRKSLLQ
ncbi:MULTISPECIES: Fe-S cluster assembly protein SufD [Porphyromonas]|uniref:Fe-S cluster assembly protein SufD n=1 Tax=Porphyromonas TaxID=836 RepID=UPI001362BEB9|nr:MULTISPECIES: Fe-S cluster assembly protein SufD [Porphyromonas]